MAETLENVQLKVPHWMSRQSPPVGYLAPFQDPPATLGMKYVWHMYTVLTLNNRMICVFIRGVPGPPSI